MMRRTASRTRADDGQIIVIFALGLISLIAMVGLVLDGGSTYAQRRGQQNAADLAALAGANEYLINGVSQAAREIARVASVHPGTTFGGPEITAVVNVQKKLIPNLGNPTFSCVAIDGGPGLDPTYGDCRTGQQVTVTIAAAYSPATPVMGLLGTWNMQSTSSVRMP